MVQFGEVCSEDEVLLDPSNDSQVLLDRSSNSQVVIDDLPEEDHHRAPLWVEVAWLVALVGTMVTLLLNLFLHRPWSYVFAYVVHHFILVLGYVQLPAPSLPVRLHERITYHFPAFHDIMHALTLIMCSSLAAIVVLVPLLCYSSWSYLVPNLLIYYFGVFVPMITYGLIIHSYPRWLAAKRVDIC